MPIISQETITNLPTFRDITLKIKQIFPAIPFAALLAACSQSSPPSATLFKPIATLQDIMQSIIDPNVDFVWNAVSSVSTAEGTQEHRPETDEEWEQLRQHALTLAEAGNLLLIENRIVAHQNANTSSGGAELNSQDIQKLIESNREDYVQRVHSLQNATELVLAAIDKKNADELEKAGGDVEHACEQCHSQFWYPNDKRPK
ncbi:cytochrome c [Methylomonas sp. AM2-LC]|uniref:cytochrome c n=1 Tax=Methylomonas sp. AM2-LC TaxID=3153301 RepID=UPI003262F007